MVFSSFCRGQGEKEGNGILARSGIYSQQEGYISNICSIYCDPIIGKIIRKVKVKNRLPTKRGPGAECSVWGKESAPEKGRPTLLVEKAAVLREWKGRFQLNMWFRKKGFWFQKGFVSCRFANKKGLPTKRRECKKFVPIMNQEGFHCLLCGNCFPFEPPARRTLS